ncbi:PAS domain S-box protein [bacterium]|nr:PAS domain S-box protein [bacterium]
MQTNMPYTGRAEESGYTESGYTESGHTGNERTGNEHAEIIIVAPLGRTADVARRMLESAGMPCVIYTDATELAANLNSAGVLLLLEEALTTATTPIIAAFLTSQQVWSDLPVIVFSGEEPTQSRYESTLALLGGRRNVSLLHRPVPVGTLISVMQSALADRRRQFEVRDLLQTEREARQALQTSRQEMREILDRIGDIFVAMDSEGKITYANRHLRQLMGRRIQMGRRICETIPELEGMDIEPLFTEALTELRPVHGEVQEPGSGRWFEFNLYPSTKGMSIYAREISERKRAEAEIQAARRLAEESRTRLQVVFNSISEGVALQDSNGNLLMMNSVGLQMNGIDPAIGIPPDFKEVDALQAVYNVRTLDGQAVPFEEWPAMKALRFEPFRDLELEITSRHHGRRWIGRFNGRPIQDDPSGRTLFVTSLQDITRQKETERALQDLTTTLEQRVQRRTEQTRRLTLALTQAEQEERQRISQFLHDDLQQILYGLQMRLHLLNQDLQDSTWQQLFKHIETMRTMLDEAIQRTRVLTVDLSPPVLKEEDLRTALIWLAEQMHLRHNLHVDTGALSAVKIADESKRTLLFQIVRELLFNVAKHAGVDTADIVLTADENNCVLKVIDSGDGFDPDALHNKHRHRGGFGLHSVQERIEILGGTLEIESTPGHGTSVILRTPLKTKAE